MADSLSRLIGPSFRTTYFDTASAIAVRIQADVHIDDSRLAQVDERWKDEVRHLLQSGELSPHDDRFWRRVLAIIAYHICGADCVSYSIVEREAADIDILEFRQLILDFPAEYTGLEFVRRLHMEMYWRISQIRKLHGPLSVFQPNALKKILFDIRKNHALARDYAVLLDLPVG